MKTGLKLTLSALLLSMAVPAQSQSLWDSLVDNTLNFYEDQDRESLFDVDGDGVLSQGDVFVGFVRIDDHTLPPTDLTQNDLYGVFSIQVDQIQFVDNGDGTGSYDITYVATSGGNGLSLQELTGDANAAGMTNAVYEGVNQNLISASPGDVDGDTRLTIFDFIAEITNDDLDLIAGYETGVDHYGTTADVTLAADPIANLVLLENATIVGGLPGATISFHAGLGITWSGGGYAEDCTGVPPEQCWARLVEDDVEGLPPSLHELGIQNGDVSGASDLLFASLNPFFSSATVGGSGQWNGLNFYGISTNADFALYPSVTRVPEPTTMALMGAGLLGMGALRRRRKS
jgi:hypothetical protein